MFNLIDADLDFWIVDGAGNSQGPYIGGFQDNGQSQPELGWNWVTGEPWVYNNWAAGEPNDAGSTLNIEDNEENYLQYFNVGNAGGNPIPGKTWNDICLWNAVKGYIIEWDSDPAPVPEPATLFLLSFGLFGLAGLRHKFLIRH